MQEPTEEIRWVVTILLAVAAIVANTGAGTNFGIILMITLLAICGVLALRYEGRGGPS
jgi:hypothetical protein